MPRDREVEWERLDKTKFFVNGAGLFSGVMAALYPLSVIKTRLMVLPGETQGVSGAVQVTKQVLAESGVRGLYRGFGLVFLSAIPTRMLYLGTLERVKSDLNKSLPDSTDATSRASVTNFVAGGVASMCSQLLVVPVDVISQRLMVKEAGSKHSSSTLAMAKHIVAKDGVKGLYRGFGASLMTITPSSALWWGAYGFYSQQIWRALGEEDVVGGGGGGAAATAAGPSAGTVAGVQIAGGLCAGITSGILTNPLDVLKTRLQVAKSTNGVKPTFRGTAKELIAEHGVKGFTRGVIPRMLNTALWGTAMVSAYEFLKRMSTIE